MEYYEYIGPYIRYMREKKNILCKDLCIHCGITRLQLSHIESGRYETHPNMLKRLLDYMGIAFISLFRNQEECRKLLDRQFQALMFDNVMEQHQLYEKMNDFDFEESILFPEYLLVTMFYMVRHEDHAEQIDDVFIKFAYFLDVMIPQHQFLYYIIQGIHEKNCGRFEGAMSKFSLADALPIIDYRELLYYQFGDMFMIEHEFMQSLNCYHKAHDLFMKKWNVNYSLYTSLRIGDCCTGMKEYKTAISKFKETATLAKRYQNEYVLLKCYEMLSLNCLLKEDYKDSIDYAYRASRIGSREDMLLFYRAYSYFKLKDDGSARLWVDKCDELPKVSLPYKYLIFVKQLLERHNPVTFLEDIYKHETWKGIAMYHNEFILRNLIECYHVSDRLLEEVYCLRDLLNI